ncbi:MAG: 4-hydroxy-tetrahydrodipicolinate synthase [Gammaproteobacteria bacterium]
MFVGSLVALVTPMKADGAIDENALRHLVDIHITKQTDALVVNGTTGESATLSFEEQLEVLRIVIDEACGRLPIIAGTGSNATQEAILKTQRALSLGADACLVVSPYYNRPTQEGLFQHYQAIAQAVDIPLILYNVPSRTGVDLLPETVIRLSRVPGILGIKECAPDALLRIKRFTSECMEGFSVYAGNDEQGLEALRVGAQGIISVVANVVPEAVKEYVSCALSQDFYKAAERFKQLEPLIRALSLESNPIPTKWALHKMKWIDVGIRLPLTPLSAQYHDQVQEALENMLPL